MIDEASGNTDTLMLMNDMLWHADGSSHPRNMAAITGADGAIQGKVSCSTAHDMTVVVDTLSPTLIKCYPEM